MTKLLTQAAPEGSKVLFEYDRVRVVELNVKKGTKIGMLAPAALVLGGSDVLGAGAITWGTVVYLGIPCSVVPLALCLRGLSSMTASLSATVLFLRLLVGFVLSIAAFGAPHAIPEFAGAVSISAAVILAAQRSK